MITEDQLDAMFATARQEVLQVVEDRLAAARPSTMAVTPADPPAAATAGSGPDNGLQSSLLGAGHHRAAREERGATGDATPCRG